MERVQVRLPEELIQELENIVEDNHYPNKSELIRDCLRRKVEDTN